MKKISPSAGIDPGESGAIAVVSGWPKNLKLELIGPLAGKGEMLQQFFDLDFLCRKFKPSFALERLPMCIGDGTITPGSTMAALHRNGALIEGYLHGIKFGPTMYSPQSWQRRWRDILPRKKLLADTPGRQQTLWKTELWKIAQGYFPDLKINKQYADALLIAINHHLRHHAY